MESYNPYWPETVIFWGAGATQPLGIMMTNDLIKILYRLTGLGPSTEGNITCVQQALLDAESEVQNELEALLTIIDRNASRKQKMDAAIVLKITTERSENLGRLYDWDAVIRVLERCPGVAEKDEDKIALQDLYNLLDMHIKSQNGLEVNGYFIPPDRLIAARRTVDMLIQLIHTINYRNMLKDDRKRRIYSQYYEFTKLLADRMIDEGLNREEYGYDSRKFYMFSYAVISMNWDPLLLWLIFNAHKEKNDSSFRPNLEIPPRPMKLFNDLAHFMAVRQVDGKSPAAWFPMNETAVQRLNDPTHNSDRIVRVGKFYFPHGSHGFRKCPKCGKLTFYLGNEWSIDSESLFPPQILPCLSPQAPRSKEEEDGCL